MRDGTAVQGDVPGKTVVSCVCVWGGVVCGVEQGSCQCFDVHDPTSSPLLLGHPAQATH